MIEPVIDWQTIVRNHGTAVWRTLFRLLGNHADADECFQETFASALTLIRADSEPVRSWPALLTRLAVARGIDRLRQRVRRSSRENANVDPAHLLDPKNDSRPPDSAERSELSERLRSALSHLPPKQADAFVLHCLEGWSYRDVADHLESTTDHVGVLIHRARTALKQVLGSILSDESSATSKRMIDPAAPRRHQNIPLAHDRGEA